MTHKIELLKPTPEQNTRRWDERKKCYVGESFDKGERIIMVDGVRWGRTLVSHHGCHGTTHKFRQDGGDGVLMHDLRPKDRHYREVSVRSMNKRHERIKAIGKDDGNPNGNWRPTEEIVLEKVKELVEAGKLRHPDKVKADNEAAMERYRQRAAEADAKLAEEFRAKAMEALQINDPTSAIIDRVVAAMEWAQSR